MDKNEIQEIIKVRLKELQKGEYSETMILCQLMQELAQRIATINKTGEIKQR